MLAIGTRSAVTVRHRTSSLPPNRCAAHPEPFSYVEVDSREVVSWPVSRLAFLHPCLRMEGRGGASANLQDSNHRRLDASSEGRRAWPKLPSPSGHLCRPTRPQGSRVAFRRAPVRPRARPSLAVLRLYSLALARVAFRRAPVILLGAPGSRGRTRTDTFLRIPDFESGASANSATRPRGRVL